MTSYRFQDFEVRVETGELLKKGYRVKLQPQPFQILCRLLESPGELVTRQELTEILWKGNAWTDTEHGLNIAVKKLRDSLGDSAEEPKLIETLARRGYRFIGAVLPAIEEENGTVEEAPEELPGPPADDRARSRGRIRWVAGIAASAAILLAAVGWRMATGRERGIPFAERDAVLVAQFANKTGEKELDGVVEPALEAALQSSQYVTVASPERVADALRLMRNATKGRIPADLAQEVCRRDAGIRAALAGNIRKVGKQYLLVGEILLPTEREPVVRFTETAADKSKILAALSKMAFQVRQRFGEDLPSRAKEAPLEKVTTSSLEALKIYSEANTLGGGGFWEAAEVLLRQALELDPHFASAHLLLAWAIRNQPGHGPADYLAHANRAVELAGTASEREALFIRASRFHLDGDLDSAVPVYETLLKRYPDHIWAYSNLYFTYSSGGQNWDVNQLLESQIRLRPNDPWLRFRSAWNCFCIPERSVAEGMEEAGRGYSLALASGDSGDAVDAARFMYRFRSLAAWVQGDAEASARELDQRPDPGPGASSLRQMNELNEVITAYLALGRLGRADALIGRLSEAGGRSYWRVWHALLSGDDRGAARAARALASGPPSEEAATALISAGRIDDGRRVLDRIRSPRRGDRSFSLARGMIASSRGLFDEAIDILTPSVKRIESSSLSYRLLSAQALARALAAKGRRQDAIRVLERATANKGCGGIGPTVFWPLARHDLMRLYIEDKRLSEAESVRSELERQLAAADETYVVKRRLSARQTSKGLGGQPSAFAAASSGAKRSD